MTDRSQLPDHLAHLGHLEAARFFGRGVEALFPGGDEAALVRPVPWSRAARLQHVEPWDSQLVADALRAPPMLGEVDPIDLFAGQPSIILPAFRYYTQGRYRRTGETYEPGSRVGNRFPFIYRREAGPDGWPRPQNLILAGHHRSAVALALGEPVRAIVVEGPWGPSRGTTPARPPDAAALTPLLFLGETLSLDYVSASNAIEAVAAIEAGETVLVADVTVGLETLLLLGVDDGEAADRVRRATRVGRHR